LGALSRLHADPDPEKRVTPETGRITLGEFTAYIQRDIPITAPNDRDAELVARRIHEAVDQAIEEVVDGVVCLYARSTCHRGLRNKVIFDRERDEYPE
jgi:hypothetical protein